MDKISEATLRNFKKLNKNVETHKFINRANKRDSSKHICPVEYFAHKENQELVDTIIEAISPFTCEGIDKVVDSLIISYLLSLKLIEQKDGRYISKYVFLNSFIETLRGIDCFPDVEWPSNERDAVGIIYQHILTEGEKNKKGSYYTPEKIIKKLVEGEKFGDKTICDPCCGSGSFLIYLIKEKLVEPDNVYGYDIDNNAAKIAKMNLFILNPEVDYNSKIQNCDYLLKGDKNYDYFITNPPWGSMADSSIYLFSIVQSGESYSYFIENCLKHLGKGKLIFLLPVSFLNVKTHLDIRSFVIDKYQIDTVFVFGKCFKGVLTDVIGVKIENNNNSKTYKVIKDEKVSELDYSLITNDKKYIIPIYDSTDSTIIETISNKGNHFLTDAEFALGIVTGNNKELLLDAESVGLRPILTGKEINPVYAEPAQKFIHYDRKTFQQVCDDRFFAAKSKLIYKFISKRLCFAVDKESTLTLNSANILLTPENFYVDDLVLSAVLSSAPMNFYFINAVNQIKVLKEDIKKMPLPNLNLEEIEKLSHVCDYSFRNKCDKMEEINAILYDFYGFSAEEIERIEEVVYGRTN